ncbi:DNA topoisomerase IV subunit B [Leifsonia xyli subsp. cynodontis DSM 46306]|uniref:Uncharacterized protein n=1 Tax=Leifsonia xyli subsp. cynodontis DSM 46306 TaxID=1389489 RepID=U3P3U5_LEIXC|nr:DNA topoisomerase IV subunit B [Leifsonia xyli subsp. cynodontis DSM 46306]AGW42528.1 DNA topoisomerase IV subunit B [Leifsonia xyli subsp. cynodontis DSM 46306]
MGRYWRKHPKKELEALLGEFHEAGWRIQDPPKYYRLYCPCSAEHKTFVHLTPSGGYYANHKLQWLYNLDCYTGSRGEN